MKTLDITAIGSDDVSAPACGVITFWRISGAASYQKLCNAWLAAGLNDALLPELPTPASALRAAVYEQRDARTLARPTKARSWVIKSERVTDEGEDTLYSTDLYAEVSESGFLTVKPAWHPLAETIRADYTHNLRELSGNIISAWLVELVERCAGITLKDTGGVYFIPQASKAQWAGYVKALEEATSNAVFAIPAMHSEQALRAITEALSSEANEAIDKIATELAAGDLGIRALETRRVACLAAGQKLQQYSHLLGASLNGLRTKLEDIEVQVIQASLMAQAAAAEGNK